MCVHHSDAVVKAEHFQQNYTKIFQHLHEGKHFAAALLANSNSFLLSNCVFSITYWEHETISGSLLSEVIWVTGII